MYFENILGNNEIHQMTDWLKYTNFGPKNGYGQTSKVATSACIDYFFKNRVAR